MLVGITVLVLISALFLVVPMVMMVADAISVSLAHGLPLNLVLLLFAHPLYLLLQELHLIGIAVSYLILLPLFVFSPLLDSPPVDVETVEILHQLKLVVEVQLAFLACSCVTVGQVLEAGTVEQILIIVAECV